MPPVDRDFGPVPDGHDPVRYDQLRRRVLWSLPTGLFVVGSRAGDRRNLMTCNWVMQIATRPKLVAVSVERDSVTRGLIEAGGGFSVSVLSRADRALVRRFVKPVDTVDAVELDARGVATSLKGEPVFEVAGGRPCLVSAVGWLSCDVQRVCSWDGDAPEGAASHVLIVGEVVDVGELPTESASVHAGVLRMEDTRMNYGG